MGKLETLFNYLFYYPRADLHGESFRHEHDALAPNHVTKSSHANQLHFELFPVSVRDTHRALVQLRVDDERGGRFGVMGAEWGGRSRMLGNVWAII